MFSSCDKEYMVKKKSYTGNELRIDGYYYRQNHTETNVLIFYRNGIMFNFYNSFPTIDLNIIDNDIEEKFSYYKDEERYWGTFIINGKSIEYSNWHTSMRAAIGPSKSVGDILNDTTFHITKHLQSPYHEFERDELYHFREFYPKPDSTNNFIK